MDPFGLRCNRVSIARVSPYMRRNSYFFALAVSGSVGIAEACLPGIQLFFFSNTGTALGASLMAGCVRPNPCFEARRFQQLRSCSRACLGDQRENTHAGRGRRKGFRSHKRR